LGGTDGRPDSGYTIDRHPGGLAVAAEVRSSRRDALGFHRSAGYSAGPPWPTAWRRDATGIVCKRLDTALAKDAAAEAQSIRDC
jgi:hypothetical protein